MAIFRDIKFNTGTCNDRLGAVGTVTGSTFSQKEKGLAIQTGQGKYIQYDKPLLPNGAFSVVVWTKSNRISQNSTFIGTSHTSGSRIMFNSSTPLLFLGANNYRYFSTTLQTGIWYCIIYTIAGVAQNDILTSQCYINSVLSTNGSTVNSGAQDARSGFVYSGGGGATEDYVISKLKVYDHVLSLQEINAEQVEFNNAQPINKPKKGFVLNKPTDLSSQVNDTREADLISGSVWATNYPYDTFVSSGSNITSAICAGSNSRTYSSDLGTFAVGDIYEVIFDLTLNSGAAPSVTIKSGNDGGTSGSNSVVSIAGHNIIRLIATTTDSNPRLVLSNTAAGNWAALNFTVRKVTGLVAAYNMQKVGNTLVDISGNNRNVTVNPNSPYVSTKDGLQCYNKGTGSVNNDLVVTTDVVTDWTYSCAAYNLDFIDNSVLFRIAGGIYFYSNNGFLQFYSGAALPFSPVITNTPKGLSVYSITYLNSTKTVTVYRNGVSIGVLVLGSALGSNSFTKILNASDWSAKQLVVGSMLDVRIHNRVLTLQEIKDYNNSFIQPTLLEDFSDAGADNQASVPREWAKTSGSFKVVENVIKNVELTAGAPNFSTNVGWNLSTATIAGGIYTGTAVGLNYCVSAITLVAGKKYKVEVNVLTTSGIGKVYIGGKQTANLAVGRSTFYIILDSVSNQLLGFNDLIGTSNYLSITEVPALDTITNGTKYLEAIAAGVVATPSNTAYGSWEMDFYKGGVVDSFGTSIISSTSKAVNNAEMNGYDFGVNSSLQYRLNKRAAGVDSNLQLANSLITANTWYRVKITRTATGLFTVLIKGGSFVPTAGYDGWTLVSVTSGTNPVTDNTYTTSNYFVMSLGAGDRVTNIKITNGLSSVSIPPTWLYGDNVLSQFWGDNLGLELWGDNL